MTVFFNDPKGESQFASFGCKDWESISSKVEFSEAIFRKDDDAYSVFCYATGLGDCQKFGNKDWKFEPCLLTFTLHSKDYEKNIKKDDGSYTKQLTKASPVEIFLCSELDKLDITKYYRGMIELRNHQQTFDAVATGKDASGSQLADAAIEFIRSCVYKLDPVEPEKLKDIALPQASSGKKGWSSGGSKGQLESERLKDRYEFVKTHLASYGESCNTLVELSMAFNQMKLDLGDDTVKAFNELVTLLLK